MFGWAFIGSGAIANTVAKEITKSGRHRLVSAYSRTESKCVKFATKYNAVPCKTFEEAVRYEGVEGVYLATPHSCHFCEIMECIKLGIPVLSEKAFTINSRQSDIILGAERHSYVSEGMWTRYNPITREVKEIVKSGQLGDILSARAEFSYPYVFSSFSERVVKSEYGGGALLDIGVYPISYMEMLFGEPNSIESTMKMGKYDTDISDDINMHYNGFSTRVRCSLRRLSTCSARIEGTRGNITMPLFYRPTRANICIDGEKRQLRCSAGYIHEFDGVASDIRAGKMESRLISLCDSHAVMRILDNIRESHGLIYPAHIESTDY